ncbi:MAG: hypothetical protein CVT66_00645 [Actinobacteria bacterium HGW-Actinobacteria-6]|nr:MAG: hypothetical protein CVT66_00645 [Actinobacteria bacterium HGW-Actinobacteria-6]
MPEFVSVPVPADRVKEVYELLSREPFRPLTARPAVGVGNSEVWTEPLIDRMFIESSSAMRRILLAIAEESPRWVTTNHIGIASGLTVRQVVASLGPFEKRVRGRYAMSSWPFEARQFVDAGIFKYSMSPETAERIVTLTAQVRQHEGGDA